MDIIFLLEILVGQILTDYNNLQGVKTQILATVPTGYNEKNCAIYFHLMAKATINWLNSIFIILNPCSLANIMGKFRLVRRVIRYLLQPKEHNGDRQLKQLQLLLALQQILRSQKQLLAQKPKWLKQ